VQLKKRIHERHDEGKLVVQGQRLRVATRAEEAEQRLRSAVAQDEILRWGLIYVGTQIAEAVTELRAVGEALEFDEAAATAKLSRDTSPDEPDLEARLRGYRAEPSGRFVERLAARVASAREVSPPRS
jgi:hypothetical protein